jgi:AcrR family transcriptional regulator
MSTREVAELQVLLEGVALPASKQELLDYARREDGGRVTALLAQLPDRRYGSLDEVGEALVSVQPQWPQPDSPQPREESGAPPGGDAYLDPAAEPGGVREKGPGP